MEKINNEKQYKYGVKHLFQSRNLRWKTIIITFLWFTNTSVYVGLSYYAPALGGDEYLNFFLAGAVEFPTYLFLWPAMERLGRRWTLCVSMIIGGTSCLATFVVQDGNYNIFRSLTLWSWRFRLLNNFGSILHGQDGYIFCVCCTTFDGLRIVSNCCERSRHEHQFCCRNVGTNFYPACQLFGKKLLPVYFYKYLDICMNFKEYSLSDYEWEMMQVGIYKF